MDLNELGAPSAVQSRTAILTGASAGLGRALARLLANEGWRLVVDARRPGPLTALAAELAERAASEHR